ncbi:MAG: hypothetical protein JWQ96_1180, partial [Segetibacter sp.]|nr:hypothetical protein [Segetibacter sp.]
HNKCKNDCDHDCKHSNCGHNKCKNDCDHDCKHSNCGHNKCKNDCDHNCNHSNCGHNKCKNDCDHNCTHSNCSHNKCKNDCSHNCSHSNCGHNKCKKDCDHSGCSHSTCGNNGTITLGNYVWNDYDGDGQVDQNEYGLGGITVSLYRDVNGDNKPDNSTPIATTVTNGQGYYKFANLTVGRYIASIPVIPGTQPGGQRQTSANPDNNVDNDNNAINLVNGVLFTNAITLSTTGEPTNGKTNNTLDLALCGTIDIGDYVWNDTNANGIQDAGEKGINGVDVKIVFPDGSTTIIETKTETAAYNPNVDKDGYYVFPRLTPGKYMLYFKTPEGYTASPINRGGNDAKDSDPLFGFVLVNLSATASNYTIDAGYTSKHNACKNDCDHECDHSNCSHNKCKNDCNHSCNHSNCGSGNPVITRANAPTTVPREVKSECALKVAFDAKDPLCYNNRTGSIVATVTGNEGNLVYKWSNGSTGNKLMNIGAGTYTVTVTDQGNGCEVTSEPVVLANPGKVVTTISSPAANGYNITCNGAAAGSIDLKASGGKGDYTYTWSNGATTQNISGLVSGKYVVTVKDETGCPAQASITLTQPARKLEVAHTVSQIDCNKQTGSIALNVTGGVAPYTYKWSNGTNSPSLDKLATGKYTVTVKDAAGCEVRESFEIKNYDLTVKATSSKSTIFTGTGDVATLEAVPTGGTGNYTYTWTPNASLTETAKANPSVKPTATTDYTVTVNDGSGCSATATVSVKVVDQAASAPKDQSIVAVSVEKVRVTPNPSTGNFNVVLSGFTSGKVEIRIMDAGGKNVMVKDVTLASSQTMVPFNLTRAPKGVYIVNVISADKSYKEKLIIE